MPQSQEVAVDWRELMARERDAAATTPLISSFTMSKLDYCNVALAGLPHCDLDRLQSVINADARLTFGAQRHDHITLLHYSHSFTGCGCPSTSSTSCVY